MTSPVIILICHDAAFGRAMAVALKTRFGSGLVGVLAIKRQKSRLKQLRSRVVKMLTDSRLERRVQDIENRLDIMAHLAFQQEIGPPQTWPPKVAVHHTDDPNNALSVAWIAQAAPDIIVVTGAPVLRARVFNLARLGTLNMHSSLLPNYRGTQAEFWQVLENRLDTAGVTIHFVDAHVDTGAIVMQRATQARAKISPQMLRTRNLIAALDAVPDAVATVLDGQSVPQIQGQGGPARRSQEKTLACRAQLLAALGYEGMNK